MQKFNSTKIIIGLNHGYGNMKTAYLLLNLEKKVYVKVLESFHSIPSSKVNGGGILPEGAV